MTREQVSKTRHLKKKEDIALARLMLDIGCSWLEILLETGYYVGGE